MTYNVGDTIRLDIEVRDPAGVLVNPTSLNVQVQLPDGSLASPEANATALGVFYADYVAVQGGLHRYRWWTTGPAIADEGTFSVSSVFSDPAPLFELEELAARLQQPIDEAAGKQARDGATALIHSYCRTLFGRSSTATETLRVRDGRVRLRHLPVTSVSSVSTIGDDGAPLASLTLWTFDGIDTVRVDAAEVVVNLAEDALTSDTVRVVYEYGHASVPADVKEVALGLAARMLSNPLGLRQETVGGYSTTIAGAEVGTSLYVAEKAVLDAYRRTARTMRVGGGRW